MLFNSLQFLLFFPIVTALYFALPSRWQVPLLLAASCYFYMAFIPVYLLVLVAIVLIDYGAAFLIARAEGRRRKAYLAISIVSNVALLAVFKYFNFINEQFAFLTGLAHLHHPVPAVVGLVLPIGLSFHTFQAMSYTIEVYRGRQEPERSLLIYALYVLFYPQLVAGPIERPYNLLPQLHRAHAFEYDRVANGLKLMCWGFFKKVVIADRVALYVDAVYPDPSHHPGLPLLLATYLFAFQIYCDFSGYTDIARGAAEVMGVRLMHNFASPYAARSVAEFWRRWHISLSTWFRDYVYLPLGGNRVARWRWYYNLIVVFILSGFWHGAAWTFIVWGLLHGIYVIGSEITRPVRDRCAALFGLHPAHPVRRALQVLITFHLVAFAWIFFRADSLRNALSVVKHTFVPVFDLQLPKVGFDGFELAVAVAAIVTMEIVQYYQRRGSVRGRVAVLPVAWRWSLYYAATIAIVLFGTLNSRQFIYFQF